MRGNDRPLGIYISRGEGFRADKDDEIPFVAQNVNEATWGDPIFKPYEIKTVNGVSIAVIGQAFPYTPIANPRRFIPNWSFGIKDENMQKIVDEARSKNVDLVIVLSTMAVMWTRKWQAGLRALM